MAIAGVHDSPTANDEGPDLMVRAFVIRARRRTLTGELVLWSLAR